MKFYGIHMQGKFVNQILADVPVTFNPLTDTGRLIYNQTDGYVWWGDGEAGKWRSLGEGGSEASETEDFYSDLLRTTIFLNCSWGDFVYNMGLDSLVDEASSTAALANSHNPDSASYTFISGQILQSNNLFDSHLNITNIPYCMPAILWMDSHPHNYLPTIHVSNDGGSTWEPAYNNQVHKFTSTGTNLKIRITATGPGVLYSWGILYNKDLSISCSKQALTTTTFIHPDPLNVTYEVGSVLVYLNGILLDDTDFTATTGETIIIDGPTLIDGDVVRVISFGTSLMDNDLYTRKDGTVGFTGDQSMGGNNLTNVATASLTGDAVNYGQLTANYYDNTVPSIQRIAPSSLWVYSKLFADSPTHLIDGSYDTYISGTSVESAEFALTGAPVWATGPIIRYWLEVDDCYGFYNRLWLFSKFGTTDWELIAHVGDATVGTLTIALPIQSNGDVFASPAFGVSNRVQFAYNWVKSGTSAGNGGITIKVSHIGWYR